MQYTFTRHLIVALLFSFSSLGVFGQACVIDTTNFQLFSPPSDQLQCVVRNSPYDLTLQLFCPPGFGPVAIDSIKVSSFPGMPTGLIKESYPVSGVMYPQGRMCIHIYGTTTDTVGYYEILYNGTAYTTQGAAPFSYLRTNFPGQLPDYALTVIDSGAFCENTDTVAAGIKHINAVRTAFSIYPNPSNGVFTFVLNAEQKLNGEITVTDVTGRTIYTQLTQAATFFQTAIDISKFSKGIYFVQYRTAEGTTSKRISVE